MTSWPVVSVRVLTFDGGRARVVVAGCLVVDVVVRSGPRVVLPAGVSCVDLEAARALERGVLRALRDRGDLPAELDPDDLGPKAAKASKFLNSRSRRGGCPAPEDERRIREADVNDATTRAALVAAIPRGERLRLGRHLGSDAPKSRSRMTSGSTTPRRPT